MKKLIFIPIVLAIGLAGCASTNYETYASTQRAIAESKASADIARYQALAEIARTGDSAARVAAVITLQQNSSTPQNNSLQAPASNGDIALKWASILVPSATQLYGITKNADIAINNSNNSRDIAINSNDSMVNMGRLIAGQTAPVVGNNNSQLIYPEPTNTRLLQQALDSQ